MSEMMRYYANVDCSVDAASFDEAETKIKERLAGHVNDLNIEVFDEPEEIDDPVPSLNGHPYEDTQ